MCLYKARAAPWWKSQLSVRRRDPRETYSNLGVRVPLFEGVELFEAEERTELVHRADAPLASLLHAHDLDDAERSGCTAGTIGACDVFCRVLEDLRKVVIAEGTICLAFESVQDISSQ